MEQIEQLREQARSAAEKIDAIETRERRAKNAKLVGKTFRTRNSYSCPEKPSDYWWLWAKCTRMDEHGFLYAFKFQTDKYGNVEIKPDDYSYHMQHYDPVSPAKYNAAWKALKAKINNFR